MKNCSICKELKSLESFAKKKRAKLGIRPECKECQGNAARTYREKNLETIKARQCPIKGKEQRRKCYLKNAEKRKEDVRKYRRENKDKIKALNKKYRTENSELAKQRDAAYYIKHKERHQKYKKEYNAKYPEKINAAGSKRRAIIQNRCPKWLSKEQLKEIELMYKECKQITKETGIPHHVDHIVPLQGKTVSGLHVPWNLRIVEAIVNLRKHNKFIEDL